MNASRSGGTAARRAAKGGAGATGTSATGRKGAARSTEAATRRRLDPDTLAALEEERDFLLRSLDDLEREHDAGDVDDADYAELKDDYTARAAAVLRAIDDRHELARASAAPRSWGRLALWVGLVVVLAVGVGVLLSRGASSRGANDGLTGDIRQDSANLLLDAQTSFAEAQQALQAGDPEAALEDYQQAIETYDRVLELSPDNVEALTYRGWVLHVVATGSTVEQAVVLDEEAMGWLDRAIDVDPDYADARVFRAVLRRDEGDLDGALADLDAVDPGAIPSFMTSMVDGVRADVEAALAAGSTTTAP